MRVAAAAEPLLERNEELARIESALAEARMGRGTFLVIERPAGIGKTALLAAARTVAADAGMHVLRSRGAELERPDLLQGAAGVAAGLLGLPGAPPADSPPSSKAFHTTVGTLTGPLSLTATAMSAAGGDIADLGVPGALS
jgi:hypothetical protein